MRILAVDSGTTTTRVWVIDRGAILGTRSARLGARDIARDDGRERLIAQVGRLADEVFDETGSSWDGIDAVVAFGMITSELGVEEIPHLRGPADATDIATALRQRDFGPTIPAPVFLVPGVRCDHGEGLETTDFMRGEETEVVGLLAGADAEPPLLYVSPGSHTKFVTVDEQGRIAWSYTTISGELLWALAQETILAGLLDPKWKGGDPGMVDYGAHFAHEYGLSRALYVARLMNRLRDVAPDACSAYIYGAVAGADLEGLESLCAKAGLNLPGRVRVSSGTGLATTYEQLLSTRHWAEDVAGVETPLGPAGAWHLLITSGAVS